MDGLEPADGAALRALRRENRRLRHQQGIQRRLGGLRELDELAPLVVDEVCEVVDCERATLFVLDPDAMELRTLCGTGIGPGEIRVPLRMGIVGTAVLTRHPANIGNAFAHPFFNPQIDQMLDYVTESILVAPLSGPDGVPLGAIQMINSHNGRFSEADETALAEAAGGLALADDGLADRLAALRERVDCERASLFRLDVASGQLATVLADGVGRDGIALNLKLGIAGTVAVTGLPLLIADAAADPRFDRSVDRRTGFTTRSILCVPMLAPGGRPIGVLQAINKRTGGFDQSDHEALADAAAGMAIAIDNALLFADQERQFRSVLEVMGASVDAKDTLTAGHSAKVAEYAVGIARELGFAQAEIDVLRVAALLHDYGKIGVDDNVLKKEGKLDPVEYAHIRRHAEITHDILDKMHLARKYKRVPLIASSHHEYLDGSGYPAGLKAGSIPFMSRIITVADMFEACTADRHYRRAMTAAQAFALLDAGAGTRFDQRCLAAMKRYWAKVEAGEAWAD